MVVIYRRQVQKCGFFHELSKTLVSHSATNLCSPSDKNQEASWYSAMRNSLLSGKLCWSSANKRGTAVR